MLPWWVVKKSIPKGPEVILLQGKVEALMFFRKKEPKLKTGYPSIDKTHLQGLSKRELDPFIPQISISAAINIASRRHMNVPVIEQRELTVTRGEYIADAEMVSRALLQLGVRDGDIVVVATPNLYQSLVIFKAVNRIGAITTFINNESRDEEIAKYLKTYNSPILVTYDRGKKYATQIINNTPARFVININAKKVDSREQIGLPKLEGNFVEYHNLKSIANMWTERDLKLKKAFDGKKEALILYTSGSTGTPKSIVFTNENVIAALTYLKYSTHAKPYQQDSFWWLGIVPFMYPYGFICSALVPLLGGLGARLAPDINEETLDYYFTKDSQVVCGHPAFLDVIFRNLSDDIKIPSMRTYLSGGDFLSVQKSCEAAVFFRKHGAKNVMICNGSGNGEVLGCATNAMGYDYRPETVGKLVLGPKYLVMTKPGTAEEKEAKYGEKGELWIAGKHVFKEYFKDPERTAKTIRYIDDVRFYRTGIYGYLDADRYFIICGRIRRFFITNPKKGGSYKVYCEYVQKTISTLERVRECVVVDVDDAECVKAGKAYIILNDNVPKDSETEQYIRERLEQNSLLKPYEIPRDIVFVDKIPRTKAGKINFELLKRRAQRED